MNIDTKYTSLKHGRMAYWDIGKGKTILMLHGFCEQKSMFSPFLELANTHRLIIPDLPGFGQSDRLTGTGKMDKYAEALEEFIAIHQLELQLLIGHSMGSYLGLHMLEKNPLLCRGFSIFHSHPYADNKATLQKRKKSIEFIIKHGAQHWLKPFYSNLFPSSKRIEMEQQVNLLAEESKTLHAEAIIFAQEAMASRKDQSATLQSYPGLVQCIIGDLDEIAPRTYGLQQVTLPKRCLYNHIYNCGHMGQWEAADEVMEHFLQMLRSLKTLPAKT